MEGMEQQGTTFSAHVSVEAMASASASPIVSDKAEMLLRSFVTGQAGWGPSS